MYKGIIPFKSVGIQVKTTIHPRAKYPQWMLQEKADNYFSETLFYVFVLLKEGKERPDFYIVPSKKVAEFTKNNFEEWKNKPRHERVNPKPMGRRFHDKDKEFLERWDLLGL